MTLPTGVRTAIGLAYGDMVDVKVSGRRIVITPTLVIDRSKFRRGRRRVYAGAAPCH